MASGFGPSRLPGAGAPQRGATAGDAVMQRAVMALNNKRPQEAEQIAREALRANPPHPRALHILGYALLMQGRAADAIAALEPAARSRHDPEIDTELAMALRQAGRTEDAQSRLKRAIKRSPPYAPAFHEFGCLLASLDRHGEAADMFRRGLDVAPMMPELSIQLGNALLQQRHCADAKAAFAQALQIAPDSLGALVGMAKAHQELGESEAAVGYFRRCLVATPDDAALWLNLGHCLLELGDRAAGFDCFRTAARGDPKRYGTALSSFAAAGRGRFWLKPSAAARHFNVTRS